jgi:hypothetical protein
MAVLAEYRKRQAEFDERQADLDAVTAKRDAGKKRYDDLRQTRHYEFMAGFNAISSKLKEMYQVRADLFFFKWHSLWCLAGIMAHRCCSARHTRIMIVAHYTWRIG